MGHFIFFQALSPLLQAWLTLMMSQIIVLVETRFVNSKYHWIESCVSTSAFGQLVRPSQGIHGRSTCKCGNSDSGTLGDGKCIEAILR